MDVSLVCLLGIDGDWYLAVQFRVKLETKPLLFVGYLPFCLHLFLMRKDNVVVFAFLSSCLHVVAVVVVVVAVVVVVCPGIQGNCGCWSWYPGPLWLLVLVSRAISGYCGLLFLLLLLLKLL